MSGDLPDGHYDAGTVRYEGPMTPEALTEASIINARALGCTCDVEVSLIAVHPEEGKLMVTPVIAHDDWCPLLSNLKGSS